MDAAALLDDRLLPLFGLGSTRRSNAIAEQHEKHAVLYANPPPGFAMTSLLRTFAGEAMKRRKPGSPR